MNLSEVGSPKIIPPRTKENMNGLTAGGRHFLRGPSPQRFLREREGDPRVSAGEGEVVFVSGSSAPTWDKNKTHSPNLLPPGLRAGREGPEG